MFDTESLPTWGQCFEIGVDIIDCEHKMMLSALNDFLLSVEHDLGERLSQRVFTVLVNYTKSHFENEEQLMSDIGYDLLERHRGRHKRFLDRLDDARRLFESGRPVRAALIELFRDFLDRHVAVHDAAIAAFARQLPRAVSQYGRISDQSGGR